MTSRIGRVERDGSGSDAATSAMVGVGGEERRRGSGGPEPRLPSGPGGRYRVVAARRAAFSRIASSQSPRSGVCSQGEITTLS